MDDFPQATTPAPSQPSPVFPDNLVRSIVRDELFRQKLADENEALRVRVAELEASAAKSIPVPAPAPVPGPVSSKSDGLAVSLPNADSGKSAVKAGGKIKWI